MTTEKSKLLKVLVGLGHRLAYATLIGLSTWVMALFPIGLAKSRAMTALVVVLDYPVAVAGLVLPHPFQGIDLVFGRGVGEFMSAEEVLLWHLRVAIPVYVFLFYLPNLISGGIGRLRKRRAEVVPVEVTESASAH